MKRKLLLLTAALLCAVFASAYTTSDLTTAGWTKITTISQNDISGNYYIFLSQDESLILKLEASSNQGNNAAFFRALADPSTDEAMMWTLEKNGSNYCMRNVGTSILQMQTESSATSNDLRWRTNDQKFPVEWTGLSLSYSDSYWTLTSTEYSRPLGIYNNVTGSPAAGNEVGANDEGNGQKFNIYAMSRAAYSTKYAPTATSSNPVNVTSYISNPEISQGNSKEVMPTGWSEDTSIRSTGNNNRTAGANAYTWLEGWTGSNNENSLKVKYYQTISTIPNGKYILKAIAGDSNGTGGGKIYISNGTDEETASMTTVEAEISTSAILTTNGSVTIGMTAQGKNSWVHATNFHLYYLGNAIEVYSPASFTNNTSATANKWYYFSISTAGYYKITSTAAATIRYTQNSSDDADKGGTTKELAAGDHTYISLSEGSFYFKSSLQSTISIVRLDNTDMTEEITNPNFDETSLTTGWTNNGMARQTNDSFNKDGSPYAECWEPNEVKSLTQTISSLPAGYYCLTAHAKARGVEYAKIFAKGVNTAIVVADIEDDYNVYFACEDNADVLIGFEGKGTGAGASWLCVDDFRLTYISTSLPSLVAVEGQMNADVASTQTSAIASYNANKNAANFNTAQDAISAAQTSKDAYAVGKAAIDKANDIMSNTNVYTTVAYTTFAEAVAAAENSYSDGSWTDNDATTFSESTLGNGWHSTAAVDDFLISAWDVAPRTWGNYYVNTWSTAEDSNNPNMVVPCIEYWTGDASELGDKTMTATMSGLTANGNYQVTMHLTAAKNTTAYAENQTTSPTGIQLQIGSATATDFAGNRVSETRHFEEDITAVGTADADGELTIKVIVNSTNASWIYFNNVKYEELASDYTALNNAIAAAEAHTLGFESGEYAPYNNVEALSALAAAKAINQSGNNTISTITSVTSALTSATWTSNDSELNALYDGDFSECTEDNTSPLDYTPAGWTASNNFRVMLKNTETYPGLADASAHSAPMSWSGGITYGETTGYTMPLEANTVYRLTFKASGWNNESRSGMTVSVLNSSDGLAATDLGTPNRDIIGNVSNTAGMTSFEKLFATGAAGNYVFHIQSGHNFVLTDLELKKATSTLSEEATAALSPAGNYKSVTLTRTLKGGQWNGFSLPFSLSSSEIAASALNGAEIKTFASAADNIITLADATEIVAGDPYLVKPESDIVNPTFNGVNVTNPEEAVKGTGAYTFQAHLYNTSLAIDGSVAYVSTNDSSIKKLISGSIKGLRSIFNIPIASGVKALVVNFGDDVDGILTIAADGSIEDIQQGNIYNLAGQRMSKLAKGVNIVNGKKVIIK